MLCCRFAYFQSVSFNCLDCRWGLLRPFSWLSQALWLGLIGQQSIRHSFPGFRIANLQSILDSLAYLWAARLAQIIGLLLGRHSRTSHRSVRQGVCFSAHFLLLPQLKAILRRENPFDFRQRNFESFHTEAIRPNRNLARNQVFLGWLAVPHK